MPLATENHLETTPLPDAGSNQPAGVGQLVGRARKRARRVARRARKRAIRWLGGEPIPQRPAKSAKPIVSASGVVESLNGREILGWVHVAARSGPVRVGLYVNDLEVDHLEPAPSDDRTANGQIRSFRFKLKDIWKFTGPKDRLSVRLDGQPLPISGRGMFYRPRNPAQRPLSELRAKLESGYVFASNGVLNESKATDVIWQDRVIGLYNRVRAALLDIAGYDAFFMYGSLLGAVRDHNFIGHDFDFDAGYVSRHRDSAKVGAEVAEIALGLLERGFRIESRVVCLYVFDDLSGPERIDLFQLYFDESGELQFPWGIAGTTPFRIEQWEGTQEIEFARTTGLIPRNAEAMVETMYGPNWRIPNPGFAWARDRKSKSTGGRVPPKAESLVNWMAYWAHTRFAEPTTFFADLVQRDGLPRVVVDLGCGDGRDTLAFAGAGFRATGLDWSASAIEAATKRAEQLDAAERPSFLTCDFDDAEAVRSALQAARRDDETVLFYGRFLLHALFDDTQHALLRTIAEQSRPGDQLALEFRGEADADRPKLNRLPRRRFLDARQLGEELQRLGFVITDRSEGIGLAPLDSEDPYLHRLLAVRSDREPDPERRSLSSAAAEVVALAKVELAAEPKSDADDAVADAPGPGLRFASAAATTRDRNEELKAVAFALIDAGLGVEHHNGDLLITTPTGPVTLGPDGDRELKITPETAEEIYWANFYAHTEYTSGSTFCAKIIETDGVPQRVIDIGCGDGRDSYAFAATDRSVLGIDRSHIGVAHASRKALQLDHQEAARFVACDVGDVERLRATLTAELQASDGQPELFYARFFLHSIPSDVQDGLMGVISELARPGDWFAAEFRTDEDAAEQKVHQKHYRRFQNGPAFGRQVEERYGFTVVEVQQGRGLSPYKGEDPHLYRIVARKD